MTGGADEDAQALLGSSGDFARVCVLADMTPAATFAMVDSGLLAGEIGGSYTATLANLARKCATVVADMKPLARDEAVVGVFSVCADSAALRTMARVWRQAVFDSATFNREHLQRAGDYALVVVGARCPELLIEISACGISVLCASLPPLGADKTDPLTHRRETRWYGNAQQSFRASVATTWPGDAGVALSYIEEAAPQQVTWGEVCSVVTLTSGWPEPERLALLRGARTQRDLDVVRAAVTSEHDAARIAATIMVDSDELELRTAMQAARALAC